MSNKLPATQVSTAPRPGLQVPPASATPGVAPGFQRERFAGPTIAQDLVMLLGVYRDLLALALWRRRSQRLQKEGRTVNFQT
jgi:hypothetical protein